MSAEDKFGLNVRAANDIVVFDRMTGHSTVRTMTQGELAHELDEDPTLRVTRKALSRGQTYIEILQKDLWNRQEKDMYRNYPNANDRLASVNLSTRISISKILLGHYQELFIISKEPGATSSRHVSY